MLTLFLVFLLARVGAIAVFGWVIANSGAMYSLLALLIFGGIALSFIPSKAKKWGWILFIAAVLLYVAIDVLAPYAMVVATVLAVAIAVCFVIVIKRFVFRWLKTAAIATWLVWVLRLI